MIIPTSVIFKAYPTLYNNLPIGTTCRTLKPDGSSRCEDCPAFVGSSVVGAKCGFKPESNPDYDLQFKLFYDEYPEYAI